MAIQGKGFMIWKVPNCESGNAANIAAVAKAAGLTHVWIKIADGPYSYNIDKNTKVDLVAPVVQELHARKIQAWGWHYVYGDSPVGEAQIAVKRIKELGLDGYAIDAEIEYKQPGRDIAARSFMAELRKGIPNTPVGLCSVRYPTLHPQIPWKEFLDKCDYNMPQVYWQAAHNPGDQLRRSVNEFKALSPFRPIIPVGPVYSSGGWVPNEAEIGEFLDTARALKLAAVSFFAWDYGRKGLLPLWNKIAGFSWPTGPQPKDLPEQYMDALNTHNGTKVAALYTSDGVHITSSATIQGIDKITGWYTNFLTTTFPNATFTLTSSSGTGSNRSFTWTGSSSAGKITNGNDTIGIIDNKIAYHYSYYTITK